MKLSNIVCAEAVVSQLKATQRDAVIEELISALDAAGVLNDGSCSEIIEAVISRENEASTGIGKGVAVPHVKHNGVKDVVAAIGLSPEGIDFSSLDKQLVYSTILLISPDDNPDRHLQAMEVVFKNLQKDDFRSFLKQAKNVDSVLDLLKEADEGEV